MNSLDPLQLNHHGAGVTRCRFVAEGRRQFCENGWSSAHCTTCHRDDHNACLMCGICMPVTGDWSCYQNRHDWQYVRRAETRGDRRYCSIACRQKAYRRRKAATPQPHRRALHPEKA